MTFDLQEALDDALGLTDDVEEELDLTGLVMTGGRPYILITLMEPEVGGVDVSHVGIDPALIPTALRQIADLLDDLNEEGE